MKSLAPTTHLRAFVPAKDFSVSRSFYKDLGAEELWSSENMVLLKLGDSFFYLQDAYVKEWAENTMLFLFVPDLELCWRELQDLDLVNRYEGIRWKEPTDYPWGLREIHLIDPAGVLWHFATEIR
ncbi:glyoxalase [Neolewinella aurantiaca]|uniref:Glyoxalase n=1 Tax=Neolewinella aurantiaca TaxID=2602767 RepID=A0A5C7FX49_9BACT|nr:glyoxalase [Neolewinella aurantiaca]TXF89516.1 glyoxalase [Neolewinella aurantiaca]